MNNHPFTLRVKMRAIFYRRMKWYVAILERVTGIDHYKNVGVYSNAFLAT